MCKGMIEYVNIGISMLKIMSDCSENERMSALEVRQTWRVRECSRKSFRIAIRSRRSRDVQGNGWGMCYLN